MLDRIFIDYSIQKLTQAAGRVDRCLEKLSDEQIWARGNTSENAVGNLCLHLCGNVRQWVISGVGCAVDNRDRDAEFAAQGGVAIPALRKKVADAVEEGSAVIRSLTEYRLQEKIVVQNYELTVMEAVYHVVEHFSDHAGQIIFATKMLTGEDLGFYRHLKAATHNEKTP
jgi:uncharacterized damage-inducible protein DinB